MTMDKQKIEKNKRRGPVFLIDSLKTKYFSKGNFSISGKVEDLLNNLKIESRYVSIYRTYLSKKTNELKKYSRIASFKTNGISFDIEIYNSYYIELYTYIFEDRKDLGVNFAKLKKHIYEKALQSGVSLKEKNRIYNKKIYQVSEKLKFFYKEFAKNKEIEAPLYNEFTGIYERLERDYLNYSKDYLFVNSLVFLLRKKHKKGDKFHYFFSEEDLTALSIFSSYLKDRKSSSLMDLYLLYEMSFVSRLLFYFFLFDESLIVLLKDMLPGSFDKVATSLIREDSIKTDFQEVFDKALLDEELDSKKEESFYSIIRNILLISLKNSKDEDEFFSILKEKFTDIELAEESIRFRYGNSREYSIHLSKLGFRDVSYLLSYLKGSKAIEENTFKVELENYLSKLEERVLDFEEVF